MKAITKKITAMAAVLAVMAAGYSVSTYCMSCPIGVYASAAEYSLTSSQISGFQKDWKAHGWVLKQGFWANNTKTGKTVIKDAQRLLNFTVNSSLDIDGQFGPATKNAVKSFQRRYGLSQDGVIGSGTWNKLISVAKEKISGANEKDNVISVTSGYNVESVIAAAQAQLGMRKSNLGYTDDWCAYYVSDLLRNAGVNIKRSANPRDLTISALNNGLGKFYCFRDNNITSLRKNGISGSGLNRVQRVSRNQVTPQRGDIIMYLWADDDDGITNWSHVGIVTGYDARTNTVYTVEGNTSGGKVANRARNYNSEVVGLLRI